MLRGNGLKGFGKSRMQGDGQESKAAVPAKGSGSLEQGASSADGEMGGHCTTRMASMKKTSDGTHVQQLGLRTAAGRRPGTSSSKMA